MTVMLQLRVDAGNLLGECPLWCERSQTLYWTDIEAARLQAWQAADGQTRQWPLPERLGSFALCRQPGQLLLGLASGIALFDLASGACGPVLPVEPDEPRTRINDGRCHAQGRFVVGMFNQAPDSAAIGHFYRVDGHGAGGLQIERLALPAVGVANCIAFNPPRRATCPAFGGPALDTLFVTSARIGLDAAALAGQPLAGGLFAAEGLRRGLPERRFVTAQRA